MLTPLPGSIFVPGRSATISFSTANTIAKNRNIHFSPDTSTHVWVPITTITDTSYTYTIPSATPATTKGFIKVTDDSDVTAMIGPFIIYPIPSGNLMVHYWAFNTLNGAFYTPSVPNMPADFSVNPSYPGSIQYVNFAKKPKYSYIDNVAGDVFNARAGAWAGNALRVRNPTDSMELHLAIPTKGYKGISISYALQASSTSGPQVEHFTYSVDGGTTWITKGMTVNGSPQDTLDVTQSQYQIPTGASTAPYGSVKIGFGSETSMDNNPNFIFRIVFGDTATSGTSGNNRFDNISVDAQGTAAVNGVSKSPSLNAWSVSPNPAQNSISFQNPFTSNVFVSILDIEGREVQVEKSNSSSITFDLGNIPTGNYFVRIQDIASGAVKLAAFVKQ